MKKILLISFFVTLGFVLKSQVYQPPSETFNDGPYVKEHTQDMIMTPYTPLREADVQWTKRVWRTVDLKEKLNHPLFYPRKNTSNRYSLMQAIVKEILAGNIIAFEDDEFVTKKDPKKLKETLVVVGDSVDQAVYDDQGNETFVRVPGAIDSTWIYENFRSIDIKEDWFFDKQKSVMEVRIVSIAFNALRVGKEELGPMTQFVLHFPSIRPVLAKYEVFNTKNDAERRSFDDIFAKRQFSSVIVREANVYDRIIDAYARGIDALLEAERIKDDIFEYEHDFWHL